MKEAETVEEKRDLMTACVQEVKGKNERRPELQGTFSGWDTLLVIGR